MLHRYLHTQTDVVLGHAPVYKGKRDSFVWGPMLMDLEYPANHRKSQLVSFHYVHR